MTKRIESTAIRRCTLGSGRQTSSMASDGTFGSSQRAWSMRRWRLSLLSSGESIQTGMRACFATE